MIINDDRLPVWQVEAVYSLIIIRTASVSKVGWTWKENGREHGEGFCGVCTVVIHTRTECHVSDLCIKSSLRLTTDMAHVESKLHRSTSKDSSIIDHCRVSSLPVFSSPPPSATDWQWHSSLSPRAALMIAHKHARGGPHAWVCLSVCLPRTVHPSICPFPVIPRGFHSCLLPGLFPVHIRAPDARNLGLIICRYELRCKNSPLAGQW